MELRRQLDAVVAGALAPSDPADAHVHAALRALTPDERKVLGHVLDRWTDAGHPGNSLPELSKLEPDDTGNVFDEGSKALIATAEEWTVYSRARARLEGSRPGL